MANKKRIFCLQIANNNTFPPMLESPLYYSAPADMSKEDFLSAVSQALSQCSLTSASPASEMLDKLSSINQIFETLKIEAVIVEDVMYYE